MTAEGEKDAGDRCLMEAKLLAELDGAPFVVVRGKGGEDDQRLVDRIRRGIL
jgi:hypothetical protein